MKMRIMVERAIDLDDAQVQRIALRWLESLKDEHWIGEGAGGGKRLWTEHVTSHRFDSEVGGVEHPLFELVEAVERLQAVLQKRGIK